VTQSSERQDQSLTQAQIDSLRQGQRLDAIDQKTKHDSSKTEVTLNAVMLEVEGKRGKPGARNKADTPQAKIFPITSATLPKRCTLKALCTTSSKIKQVSPLFDHFSQKLSPLLAHAHIKPKICLKLPLKSCYAMNVVQRVYVKHSGIHRYDQLVTGMCAS